MLPRVEGRRRPLEVTDEYTAEDAAGVDGQKTPRVERHAVLDRCLLQSDGWVENQGFRVLRLGRESRV